MFLIFPVWMLSFLSSAIAQEKQPEEIKERAVQTEPLLYDELNVSHWIPANNEINYARTEIENSSVYSLNSDYGFSTYFRVGQNWLRPEDKEGDEPQYFFDDPFVAIIRKWKFPLRAAIYFPVSDPSKDAHRRFTFSLQPTFYLSLPKTNLKFHTEFRYFNNKTAASSEDETQLNTVYGVVQKIFFQYSFSSSWSWVIKSSVTANWDSAGSPQEYYENTLGPAYHLDQIKSISLNYYSADKLNSEYSFLSKDVSWVGLMLSFTFS